MSSSRTAFGLAIFLVCAAVAPIAGCSPHAGDDDVIQNVSSPLVIDATGSGLAYSNQCNIDNGVPLPPDFWMGNIGSGGPWVPKGQFSDGFTELNTAKDVYINTQSNGVCAIAAGYNSVFVTLCQGTNGKACFWEHTNMSPLAPMTFASRVVIAATATNPGIPGGTALAAKCTTCHAGGNAFLTHYGQSGHPLNQSNSTVTGWVPAAASQPYVPIVPSESVYGWPHNRGPSTANYPSTCTACHTTGGLAGPFPALDDYLLNSPTQSFCLMLNNVMNRPSSAGGMPVGSTCTPDFDCPKQIDPNVQDMLAACGRPALPSSALYGVVAPHAGARRMHVSNSAQGIHQHYFYDALVTMPNATCCANQGSHPTLSTNDIIEVWVFLPKFDMPREVMIQVRAGTSWYRAYWGEDLITTWGARTPKGPLPDPPGSWYRLSFTAADVGLPAGSVLNGMAFTLYDGSAYWSNALFRRGDAPYSGNLVSQVWVGDWTPGGATEVTESDAWQWKPDNQARGGWASQSTVWGGYDADRGIDGNRNGNFSAGSVFHTNSGHDSSYFGLGGGGEYWIVDMRSSKNVNRVILHNRTDGNWFGRLSGFRIAYVDGGGVWRVASDQSGLVASAANPVISVDFPKVTTQYLMVQKTNADFLHLAEVEVLSNP